jgi:hypothetical protein
MSHDIIANFRGEAYVRSALFDRMGRSPIVRPICNPAHKAGGFARQIDSGFWGNGCINALEPKGPVMHQDRA